MTSTPDIIKKLADSEISREMMLAVVRYEPETGMFFWLHDRPFRAPTAGKLAGTIMGKGYRTLKINGRMFLAHRVAWLVMTGEWPSATVDHINRVRSDNRWLNLRLAPTRRQQAGNVSLNKNNTSGVRGVGRTASGRYRAEIGVGKISKRCLGTFDTIEQAKAAYNAAAREHFGEFYNG